MDGNSSQKVVAAPPSDSNYNTSSSQEPLNNIRDIVETSDKEISTISLIKPEYDNVSPQFVQNDGDDGDDESFENNEEQDDQSLSFINHSDYDDDYDDGSLTDSSGNYLVSSIHTNELGSDNSSVIHDDDNLDVDTFFLSQSSQLSEDSGSIVSYPNSDVMNSLVATPEISYQDEHEHKVPIMPAPGETIEQILAPLNEDEIYYDNNNNNNSNRVEYTPIITKVENETDPPPIFITNNEVEPSCSSSSKTKKVSSSYSSIIMSDLLLRHNYFNALLGFQNISVGEIVLTIIQHQIIFPFIQGFSWGIGVHFYRYLRNTSTR